MSRAQQGQVFDTAQQNQATNESAAQASDKSTQADIGEQQSKLAKFAAQNPYVQGGQMQTATNQELSNTADATAAAAAEKAQMLATRTGQNPGAAIAAGEAEQQAAQRALGLGEAGATQSRLAAGAKYGQDVLGAQGQITQEQQQLATQESNAAQGNATVGEQAAQTPSFLDELGSGLIEGGVKVGEAYCPARGSLIMMGDGGEIRVEEILEGDQVAGIDGETQTVREVTTAIVPIVTVRTEDGFSLRCSREHAFASPFGGFVEAADSIGKKIITGNGVSTVAWVDTDGIAQVFSIVTDGTHTYRANKFWSLGVGLLERKAQTSEKAVEVGG